MTFLSKYGRMLIVGGFALCLILLGLLFDNQAVLALGLVAIGTVTGMPLEPHAKKPLLAIQR